MTKNRGGNCRTEARVGKVKGIASSHVVMAKISVPLQKSYVGRLSEMLDYFLIAL